MGQALYRKYRPKSWSELIGQEHITNTLEKAISSNQISHAYLFTGPRGVGKTSAARILAYVVNGLPYDEEATHIDIVEIDAASNRRIDEIRDLRERVNIVPTSAKYKVYIIDEVHMLTKEAFNALLKTLEEPPAHVIFVLATTESYKLPATIVSRTQRFTFRPVEQSKAAEHLKMIAQAEKINIDDAALDIIARHGEGSIRDSVSLLDQMRNSSNEITALGVLEILGEAPPELIAELLKSIENNSQSEIIINLNKLAESGYEPARLAKQLGDALRQDLLSGQSKIPQSQALQLMKQLIDIPTSPNPSVALEIVLLENSVGQIKPLLDAPVKDKSPAVAVVDKKEKIDLAKADVEVKTSPKQTATDKKVEISNPDIEAKTKITDHVDSDQVDFDLLWDQVLDVIKKNYNTLYGILRMAKPELTNGKVSLNFAFVFHKKRIDELKNRQIIADTINELSGQVFEIQCVVDSDMDTSSTLRETSKSRSGTKTEEYASPSLETINNIFGGGELLES